MFKGSGDEDVDRQCSLFHLLNKMEEVKNAPKNDPMKCGDSVNLNLK